MLITDEIRNVQWYDLEGPLRSENMKDYDEYLALAILRYCYPDLYMDYEKLDGPDLQNKNGKHGVEVTLATSEVLASVEGNYAKYQLSADTAQKEKLRSKIEKTGACIDPLGLSYPVEDSQQDEEIIRSVIQKKLSKLNSYREKGFEKMELFIRFSGIPCILSEASYIDLFAEAKGYETIYFTAPSCLMSYHHSDKKFECKSIPREDYDALGVIARFTVDRKINIDSPIWTEYGKQ
jgi:hypothetical protein